MADKPNSKQAVQRSRRKLLTMLSVGAAVAKLPDGWTKPTVASVMLPAHAKSTFAACTASEFVPTDSGTTGAASYTVGLVARAVGLPEGTSFNAFFTYPGGSTAIPAGPNDPGTVGATVLSGATVPYGSLCGGLFFVNFYPAGTPGIVVCADSFQFTCTLATME